MKNGNVDFYYRSVENGDLLEGVIVGKNTLSYLAVGQYHHWTKCD